MVTRGAVTLAAHLDRAGRGAAGHPGDSHVEVDVGAGIRRDAAGDLAEEESVAVEVVGGYAAGKPTDEPFGSPGGQIAEGAVGRFVGRFGVDHIGLGPHRGVEH